MADKLQYKPYYLKVTSRDEAHPIANIPRVIRPLSEIFHQSNRSEEVDERAFGFFNEQFRTLQWVVLQFNPYSVDWGIQKKDTAYETQDQSLNAAVQYLSDHGYQAKIFDLEGMIDVIQ